VGFVNAKRTHHVPAGREIQALLPTVASTAGRLKNRLEKGLAAYRLEYLIKIILSVIKE